MVNTDFLKDYEFFAGVPDSLLKPLCNELMYLFGISRKHIIAANEGNAVALAAGYHLATGKVPVVYLQNSGIGNIINPVVSLLNDKIYGIPCIFIIGWRGEFGAIDEPQHIFQGEITIKLLEDMEIPTFIISKDTTKQQMISTMETFVPYLAAGRQVAFVVQKDAIVSDASVSYSNHNNMRREEIIQYITVAADQDLIISTTGKTSRELFEMRRNNNQTHDRDFLTFGSMGHSSSIALGIALHKPNRLIWCIDGDGAALMHMGAMAVIGANAPKNMVHIIINNAAHESVGGMPTVANDIDFVKIALGCGYPYAVCVDNVDDLNAALGIVKKGQCLAFIEARCAIGARRDLGRPTLLPKECKEQFMDNAAFEDNLLHHQHQ
jgi:phosphonopyruvate decarboxylase